MTSAKVHSPQALSLDQAPFALGFTDYTVATVLYVVIGAGGLGATLLTRFESDLMPAGRLASQQLAV
jgi:hypothetical protein